MAEIGTFCLFLSFTKIQNGAFVLIMMYVQTKSISQRRYEGCLINKISSSIKSSLRLLRNVMKKQKNKQQNNKIYDAKGESKYKYSKQANQRSSKDAKPNNWLNNDFWVAGIIKYKDFLPPNVWWFGNLFRLPVWFIKTEIKVRTTFWMPVYCLCLSLGMNWQLFECVRNVTEC